MVQSVIHNKLLHLNLATLVPLSKALYWSAKVFQVACVRFKSVIEVLC